MKPQSMLSIGVFVAVHLFSALAAAEVPLLVNYRGYVDVTDPVIDLSTGALTVDLEFNLYDTSETEGATALWTETQTAQLLDGNFAVLLGSVNPLNLNLFSAAQRYLTVSVEGNLVIGAQQILSVPYAMQAGNVYSASDGKVGIGTTSPSTDLHVDGIIKANHLQASGNLIAGGSVTSGGVVQSNSGGFKFPDGTAQASGAVSVPVGGVIAWWGDINSVPENFELCDGNPPTTPGALLTGNKPNLLERFVRGAVSIVGATGGQDIIEDTSTDPHQLTIPEMPRHNHYYYNASEGHCYNRLLRYDTYGTTDATNQSSGEPNLTANGMIQDSGGDQPHSHGMPGHDNRPAYCELFYIIRVK